MSNTTVVATIFVTAFLVSIMFGAQGVEVAKANWIPIPPEIPPPLPPTISIVSPQVRIYHETEISFSFAVEIFLREDVEFRAWNETLQALTNRTLRAPSDRAGIPFISYTLDGVETIIKNITTPSVGVSSWDYATVLTGLSEGRHTLMVNASGRQSAANLITMGFSPDKAPIFVGEGTYYSPDVWSNSEVTFIVDAATPTVSIQSPKNSTYSTGSVLLNFIVDEPVTWTGYSLDGADLFTCTSNVNLLELSDGSHSLVVYANDTAGNMGKSETIFFTINTPTSLPTLAPTQSPSPTFPSPTSTGALSASPTPSAHIPTVPVFLAVVLLVVVLLLFGIVCQRKNRRT